MCSCAESPYPCSRCRHTSNDPAYFDPQNDVLGDDPYNLEPAPVSPAEYQVTE